MGLLCRYTEGRRLTFEINSRQDAGATLESAIGGGWVIPKFRDRPYVLRRGFDEFY